MSPDIVQTINKMQARDLCLLFPVIKNRLGQLDLWKTVHKFDEAQSKLGWEVAEQYEREHQQTLDLN